jgi:predicted ATP-dependent serine protease
MAIEHLRICGACERECPGWANRCPACGSLSLLYRVTFVSAPVVASETTPRLVAGGKTPRKTMPRPRIAAQEATLRKTPLGGKPETRAV